MIALMLDFSVKVLQKKNGKSLCIACHLYARTMLIFSVLLKLTDVLSRTIVRQNLFSPGYINTYHHEYEKRVRLIYERLYNIPRCFILFHINKYPLVFESKENPAESRLVNYWWMKVAFPASGEAATVRFVNSCEVS